MPLPSNDRSHHSAAGPSADSSDADVTFRLFASPDDARACVAVQEEIWGAKFDDYVAASLLHVATYIGGLAIGAFAPNGTMLGFVFSLVGTRGGETVHWSHMLAVREHAQGSGIGRRLKEAQRAELARRGIARVFWTFDPLQARNAHLNFNRLGVHVVDYVPNMYGVTRSPLHLGLPTDRLIVVSPTHVSDSTRSVPGATLNTPTRAASSAHRSNGQLPVLTPFPRPGDLALELRAPRVARFLIEIPSDLQQLASKSAADAGEWRRATRDHFQWALGNNYAVAGLERDSITSRAYYVLTDGSGGAA
jgi:predicted GNAT superfamily acetyltransferase